MEAIKEVTYCRERHYAGHPESGVEYLENVLKDQNGDEAIRLGIILVKGKTIKAMKESLLAAIRSSSPSAWWSLQATSLKEMKASFQTGFRCEGLKTLAEHVEAFEKNGGTLHVERRDG